MAGLVLVCTGRDPEIAAFNAASPLHKLHPASLADGTMVLPVSLLTWAGKGQGYFGAWDLLLSLPVRRITMADWPKQWTNDDRGIACSGAGGRPLC